MFNFWERTKKLTLVAGCFNFQKSRTNVKTEVRHERQQGVSPPATG